MLLALLVVLACTAAQAADPATERQRIVADRQAAESRFAAEEADCRQRFAVTPCLEDTQRRRRSELAGLRDQELALDEAERRARAAERRQDIERKRARAAARPAPASGAEPAASASVPAPAGVASAASASAPAPRRAPDARAARDAQRRASAAEQRHRDAEATRARIAAREAERAAQGKESVPLPLPAEVAASAPAR